MKVNDKHYISNSEVQAFKRCRRKWWLGWYRGLTPKVEDLSSIMRSGTRIHKALATWYVSDRDPELDLMAVLEEIINEDKETIKSRYPIDYTKTYDVVDPSLTAILELEKIASYERAMLEGYLEWIEETGIDSELNNITTEQEIIVPHYDLKDSSGSTLPIYFVGIVDALMYSTVQKGLAYIDHKTVQSLTQPLTTLRMNEQMLHYIFLLQQATNERVIGAYYNMIRRVKRTANAKPPFYDRVFIPHSQVEIDAYRRHLYGVAYSIYATTINLDDVMTKPDSDKIINGYMYPSPRSECSWDCPFFSICPMFDDGSDTERMISYLYVKDNQLARYTSISGE